MFVILAHTVIDNKTIQNEFWYAWLARRWVKIHSNSINKYTLYEEADLPMLPMREIETKYRNTYLIPLPEEGFTKIERKWENHDGGLRESIR
jgi:hypothetical protein